MIERQTIPYEYLVRFNADGTVRGQHIAYLTRIVDTVSGEVFAEREGNALSVGDQRATVMLNTALGQVRAAVARAEELERLRRIAAEEQRAEFERLRDRAIEMRDALQAEKVALQAQLDAALSRIAEIEAAARGDGAAP